MLLAVANILPLVRPSLIGVTDRISGRTQSPQSCGKSSTWRMRGQLIACMGTRLVILSISSEKVQVSLNFHRVQIKYGISMAMTS